MAYKPAPRDTSSVRLPRDLGDLTEMLARNTRENWAQRRMAEGWTFGPERDDRKNFRRSGKNQG